MAPRQRNAGGRERVDQHALVARRGDAIEDDAGDAHAGAPIGKAGHQRRDGLALPIGIDDQNDGQFEQFGQIAGGAGAIGSAIEQAHDAFDEQQIGASGLGGGEAP